MTNIRNSEPEQNDAPPLQAGVFQPGRAEIAREMESRLHLASGDYQSPSSLDQR